MWYFYNADLHKILPACWVEFQIRFLVRKNVQAKGGVEWNVWEEWAGVSDHLVDVALAKVHGEGLVVQYLQPQTEKLFSGGSKTL